MKPLRFRHKKSRTDYELVGTAVLQTDVPLNDMDEVIVYVKVGGGGTLWARRKAQFYDGRFELLKDWE